MARLVLALAIACACAAPAAAGPYTEPGHAPAEMLAWASAVDDFARGPLDVANPGLGNASHGTPASALGPALAIDTLDAVSLGDGGHITLFFAGGIGDGAGDDLAVFENSFYGPDGLFAELAFVEVSSDGSQFARFEPITLHDQPVLAFGTLDPTDLWQLAGKQPLEQGAGFDLAELVDHPLVTAGILDLDAVSYVRVVDVIGNGSTLDALGAQVFDPYPTAFSTGGFDLQAVGVLHAVPEPGAVASLAAGACALAGLARRRLRRT